jgi:two-component system response regulator YesN
MSRRKSFFIKWSNWTFKHKLFAFSLTLSITPVLILGLASSYITSHNIQEEVNRNQQIILKQLEIQVDSFMRSLDSTSLALANSKAVQTSLKSGIFTNNTPVSLDMIDTVLKATGNSEVAFDISLYYSNYNIIYSSLSGINRDITYPYPDIIQSVKLMNNGLTIIPPNSYPNMKEMMLVRSVPLNATNPDGYLILQLDIARFKRFLDQLDLGDRRKVLIVDDQGRIIASRDFEEVGTSLSPSAGLYRFWTDPGFYVGAITMDDFSYNVSSFKSSLNNWTYIALSSTADMTAKSRNIRSIMWAIVAGLVVVWGLLAIVGSRRFYFPIQRLAVKFAAQEREQPDGLTSIDTFMDRTLARNEHLELQLNEQIHYMKEFKLLKLLHGEMTKQEAERLMAELGMEPRDALFYTVAIDMDKYVTLRQIYSENDRFLIQYALRNIIEELGARFSFTMTITSSPGQLVMIIGEEPPAEEVGHKFEAFSSAIRKNVKECLNYTVSVAVSSPWTGYSGICDSYRGVQELLHYRWVGGPDQHIDAKMVEPILMESVHLLVKLRLAVIESVLERSLEQANGHLSEMVEVISGSMPRTEASRGLFVLLLGEIDQRLTELGYRNVYDMFEYDLLAHLYNLPSLKEVNDWMQNEVLPTIIGQLQANNHSKQKKLIIQVRQYIAECYDTDLSLQVLADRFGVSVGTLSRMFKEESGDNYVDYIIRVRIDQAKEWLIHTDLPIKVIAEKLRYTNVNNFTRIFKQITGVPPGNFRKRNFDPNVKSDNGQ